MTYGELLEDLGRRLKFEITPDDSGTVNLAIDSLSLSIVNLEANDLVVLSGEVGDVPPEDHRERLYKSVLMANHNFAGANGAMFSVNPADGKVCLAKIFALPVLTGDSFYAEVEKFVNMLETWHKIVTDFNGSELDAEGNVASSSNSGGEVSEAGFGGLGGFGDFMQV